MEITCQIPWRRCGCLPGPKLFERHVSLLVLFPVSLARSFFSDCRHAKPRLCRQSQVVYHRATTPYTKPTKKSEVCKKKRGRVEKTYRKFYWKLRKKISVRQKIPICRNYVIKPKMEPGNLPAGECPARLAPIQRIPKIEKNGQKMTKMSKKLKKRQKLKNWQKIWEHWGKWAKRWHKSVKTWRKIDIKNCGKFQIKIAKIPEKNYENSREKMVKIEKDVKSKEFFFENWSIKKRIKMAKKWVKKC